MGPLDLILGNNSDSTDSSSVDVSGSLDNLANSAISSIGGALVSNLTGKVNPSQPDNSVRSQNSAPAPDLTAKAAQVSSLGSLAAGVSIPILALGLAVVVILAVRR